jgi:formamidopyrimidine-DNA glycosylase
MPELPEVETVRRGLEPHLHEHRLISITLNRSGLRYPFPKDMKHTLKGKKCHRIRRRGKYLLFDFDDNNTLVVHLGMSGSFTINPSKQNKHDHVIFVTDKDTRIVYHDPRRFGMFFLIKTNKEQGHKTFAKMGPEPFDPSFNASNMIKSLMHKTSPIKTALLDQSIVAGIGNIYACEALYMSGISPLRPANTIKGIRMERLVTAIKDVLNDAILSGGSTLRDHRQTDGTMGYFQHNFKVYGKDGSKCPDTNGIIKKIVQSGRSTFYCPAKQR